MTARVRPITVMGAAAVVVVVLVAVFAWTRDDATVVGQPASLPIMLGSGAEAALAPATTVSGTPTYVRGPDVADPGGSRPAWTIAAGNPDPAAVRRLADALGVSGDLRQLDGMWQIGADDGPNVKVQLSAGQAWNYWPGGVPQVAVVCAEPLTRPTVSGGPDTATSSSDPSGCVSTPPPAGLPTDAEAEDATRDLLHRAGLDADPVTVVVSGSEWGTVAVASRELDGIPTHGIDTTVSFGADAAITSASGVLGSPSRTDDYPLIGVDAAIARLNSGHDVLDGLAPMAMAGSGMADAVDSATANGATSATAAATAGSSMTTVPITTVPEPTTTTSTTSTTSADTAGTTATTWGCAVPLDGTSSSSPEASSGSSSGPRTTTTIVGVGDGDAGGSGGSGSPGSPGCAGSVSPCPPCPSDTVCSDLCNGPSCDPAACTDPHPGPTVVPSPPDEPTGPTVPVTITSAEVVLAGLSGYDGAVWLVPAYRFHTDDGATITVLAVDDAFVAPAPAQPEPAGATDPTAADATTPMTAPAQPAAPEIPPATFTSPGSDGSGSSGGSGGSSAPSDGGSGTTGSTPCTAPWMC